MTLTTLKHSVGFLKSYSYYTYPISLIPKFGNCRDTATDNYALCKQLKGYEELSSKCGHSSEMLSVRI